MKERKFLYKRWKYVSVSNKGNVIPFGFKFYYREWFSPFWKESLIFFSKENDAKRFLLYLQKKEKSG